MSPVTTWFCLPLSWTAIIIKLVRHSICWSKLKSCRIFYKTRVKQCKVKTERNNLNHTKKRSKEPNFSVIKLMSWALHLLIDLWMGRMSKYLRTTTIKIHKLSTATNSQDQSYHIYTHNRIWAREIWKKKVRLLTS